jgi:dUTP pyrophosphatase
MIIKFKKLKEDAIIPTREEGSSGYDLYANEDVWFDVGNTKIVSTGISLEMSKLEVYPTVPVIPMFKIEDRSSMAAKGFRTGAGVVDDSYRGEIKVVMHNFSNRQGISGTGCWIKKGDKIAQGIVLATYVPTIAEVVGDLTKTTRDDKGFGSTGA